MKPSEKLAELLALTGLNCQLVAKTAVERLDPGVLPRRSGIEEDRVGAAEPTLVRDRVAMNSSPSLSSPPSPSDEDEDRGFKSSCWQG